jgi:dTDP-3-amino-3,4,6-trideoxy-alpha-D-glucose transaminase
LFAGLPPLSLKMQIPAVNLQPCLDATRPAWTAHLEQLFTRMQFILGEHVSAFEREFAEATGAEEVVGVGNGTDAIELCLRQACITNPNQEVIAPALTAPFTAIGILAAGCRLRLADVDPDTLLLDPASASAIATSDRTAAIVPVHLYGQPCDLVRIASIATEFGASLIQDACQAHGARFRGKPLTAYSSRVAYSFYPTKNLGCLGDGGAIATSKRSSAARLRMFRDGGRRGGRQNSYVRGINSRLDEMQACYLRAFLPRLEEWNNWRRKIAAIYDVRQHLSRNGIGTGVHYPVPLHHMQAFRDSGVKSGQLPVAEKACSEVLSLPLWPYLPESDARFVAEKIREFYGHRT